MNELSKRIMDDLVKSSKYFSSLHEGEIAGLQEAAVSCVVMSDLDGHAPEMVSQPHGYQAVDAEFARNLFAERDMRVLVSEANQDIATVMIYVADKMDFENLPTFLQNYMAESMIPGAFSLALEKIKAGTPGAEFDRFVALPYFVYYLLSGKEIQPAICFVGEQIRDEVTKSVPQEKLKEATADLQFHIQLVASYFTEAVQRKNPH